MHALKQATMWKFLDLSVLMNPGSAREQENPSIMGMGTIWGWGIMIEEIKKRHCMTQNWKKRFLQKMALEIF